MYCTNIMNYDIIMLEVNCIQYTISPAHINNDFKGDNAYDTLEKL